MQCQRWGQAFDILPDFTDAAGRRIDLALGIADLPPDGKKIVVMGGAQTLQVRNIGLQPGLQHQPFIAGRNGLGHGVPVRLTFVQISQSADRGIAGKSRGDEPGLSFVVLLHRGVERALRGVGEDIDLAVLFALADDAALALLDLQG